jgi:hypothetical protein
MPGRHRHYECQGALLLLSPEKKGGQYQLRYYQLDEGKGRLLGDVPFAQATKTESQAPGAPWAFALAGPDPSTGQSVIIAGDTQAIHARLPGASDPHFSAVTLGFQSAGGQSAGEPRTLKIPVLLGQETIGYIYAPRTPDQRVAYLQFFPDGNSLTTTSDGKVETGRWITDGSAFHVTPAQETAKGAAKGDATVWNLVDLRTVTGVPAESHLNVRLLHPLSSRTAKKGMPVQAILISPGVFDGDILLPQGSEFDGTLVAAHGVGWGIRHETAALTIHFDSIKLPAKKYPPRVPQMDLSAEQSTEFGAMVRPLPFRTYTENTERPSGIAFSYKQKTFIHVIDQYLDNGRSKVTNDLDFTGCVDGVDLASRPWVPRDAYNSTGDRLITDGAAAALRLNHCESPYATPATAAPRAPAVERTERDTMLTIKDTLYRGNLVYAGISGGIKVHQYLATQGQLCDNTGAWRRSDASGTEYRVVGSSQPQLQRRKWGGEASIAPAEPDAEVRARVAAQHLLHDHRLWRSASKLYPAAHHGGLRLYLLIGSRTNALKRTPA